MYAKLAWGNVRRSLRDYSVYFLTLAFAACLLYLFTASGDFLEAMDLTPAQRAAYGKAGDVVQAFLVLTVLVFVFLVAYANRFILRRRSREFALYGLLGMRGSRVARILAYEGGMVGACALLAGIAVGTLLSPLFGGVVAFVFDVPWKLAWVFSPHAALWCAGCFAAIMALATFLGARSVQRRSLLQLMTASRAPERMLGSGRRALGFQLAGGVALVGAVWAVCVFQPVYFLALILPLGVAAVFGTCLVFRYGAVRVPALLRRREGWYLRDLHCFAVRQVEAKVSSSALAMACVCVLIAVAVCMIAAGLLFSVGMRGMGSGSSESILAPFGFVGILYGLTFMVAAAAVLALQQLSEAADGAGRYRVLSELGVPETLAVRAMRAQVGTYFGVPLAGALVHCAFGLVLVGFLAETFGSASFMAIALGTVGGAVLVMGLYYLVTCAACRSMV